jgi:hypothetical protein
MDVGAINGTAHQRAASASDAAAGWISSSLITFQ